MSNTDGKRADLLRLVGSCALLTMVVALAAVVVSAIVHRGLSAESLQAAWIGGGVCWLAATLALVATHVGIQLNAPVQGMLGSMIFRMGLPLAGLTVLPKMGGPFAAGGVSSTILGVYLVALAVETVLALRMVPARPFAAASPGAATKA